ncbi:Red1p Ecym_3134 [Eremothecium cymbalariae DBVPG|uniref:Uncharacterized protein n=1 Tax=Eremothecium cymbalariae (strain CBS 270.75 / DBVPG 7215 / KCTC 17166 / NRRL Y-17582) TaxID=931890 RepID=G8JR69_ERECY|nr:Hypothetical protein Ecym_3134 [Eremothecium cymbalariae DBVPG\
MPCAWQNLAFLAKIYYELPEYKNVITSMFRSTYSKGIGQLLDSINDFQMCNYLVELLSNVFTRKSTNKTGVVMPPNLWDDEEKNALLFNNPDYPYRGKHGDASVVNFIWKRFGPFFTNLVKATCVKYTLANGRSKPLSKSPWCSIQVLNNKIYIWDGEGLFIQFDITGVEVIKDLKEQIRIKLLKPFLEVVTSPHVTFLNSLGNVKSFRLEFDSTANSETFMNATKIPKISEVQNFIALKFPSSFEDEILDSSMPLPDDHQPLSDNLGLNLGDEPVVSHNIGEEDIPRQQLSTTQRSGKNPLATPDQTVDKGIAQDLEDEWDLRQSSLATAKLDIHSLKTPTSKEVEIVEDEQSPLVMAQKRRLARATSRTLEALKQEFGVENINSSSQSSDEGTSQHELSESSLSSLEIEKFESRKRTAAQKAAKRVTAALQNTKAASRSSNTNKDNERSAANSNAKAKNKATSAVKGDMGLAALDDIFAIPSIKPKKQQKLNNYKEVVYVPSRDPTNDKGITKKSRVKKKQTALPVKRKHDDGDDATGKDSKAVQRQSFRELTADTDMTVQNKQVSVTPAQEQKDLQTPKTPEKVNKTRYKRKRVIAKGTAFNLELPSPPPLPLTEKSDTTTSNNLQQPSRNTSMTSIEPLAPGNLTIKNELTESTTLANTSATSLAFSYTNKLQEQIFSSISSFSNDLVKKISIINEEMDNKIVRQFSEKYQKLFHDLQVSFQHDVNNMSCFVSEFKDLLHLPEEELIKIIRNKKFT